MTSIATLVGGRRRSRRPAPIAHAPLPPFDPNDDGGEVHTVLPPEQVIPDHFTDPTFMRADFTGVTLDLDRWNPGAPAELPFLAGANSTPKAMLMTPMLALYPPYWRDADFTEHAERGYDDFVSAHVPWNAAENGVTWDPSKLVLWLREVKSWGFRNVLWYGGRPPDGPDAYVQAACDAGLVDFLIWGKEVDSQMTSEEYDASLQDIDRYIGGRLPIAAHFSADADRQMGYPIGMPRETFLNDWNPYDGRVHLCNQQWPYAEAGRQGAAMYYARLRVNCGIGPGAWGPGAPNSRVIAFETMATAQLYGQCDEGYGCLRDWELLCGTRDNPKARPVSGFGNGNRYPNGAPI